MKIRRVHMSVTICAFSKVTSCFDSVFQTKACRDKAAFLFSAIMETVFAIAIFCGVSFEAVVSVHVGAPGDYLL